MLPLVLLAVLLCCAPFASSDKTERDLYDKLLAGYNKFERPVANHTRPLAVSLGLVLQQIIDLDETEQVFTVNAWLKYTWTDANLKWEPSEHGGITDLRLPLSEVWRPDVVLYNSVDPSFESTFPTQPVIYSDGTVNWIPPGIFKASCNIDMTYFPFDKQTCMFKFGSWTYDGNKIDLQADVGGLDTSEYMPNGEWELTHTIVQRNEKFYDCCPEPYPDVRFFANLQRRSLYYWFNLILPAILIVIVACVGFLLPPTSTEKTVLQVAVMLWICFLLNVLVQVSPPSSQTVPLLGVFFSLCLVIVALGIVMTVLVLWLHNHRPGAGVPQCCRPVLLHCLPTMMCMKPTDTEPGKVTAADEWRLAAAAVDTLCFILLTGLVAAAVLYTVLAFMIL